MKDNEKRIDEQEKLLDHIIEYGGRQYIADEVKKYEEMPEMELSDEFNDRMDKMFKNAYKKEVKKERIQTGKKAAAISIIVLGIAATTAMNVRAFREPVLNFIFKMNASENKANIKIAENEKSKERFSFGYIPEGYKCTKKQYFGNKKQFVYSLESKNSQPIYIKMQLNKSYTTYSKLIKDNYTEISKNSRTYYFISSNNNRLLWYHNKTIFNIISNKTEDELIKIAENIKINN